MFSLLSRSKRLSLRKKKLLYSELGKERERETETERQIDREREKTFANCPSIHTNVVSSNFCPTVQLEARE